MTRLQSRELVFNYVTQIDRVFTVADITQTTHVPKTSACRTVNDMLAAGQLVEVKCPGDHTRHYRYNPPKHKPLIPFYSMISAKMLKKVQAAYDSNPKQTQAQMAVALGCSRSLVSGALRQLGITKQPKRFLVDQAVCNRIITDLKDKPATRGDISTSINLDYHTTWNYLKHLSKLNIITFADTRYSLVETTDPGVSSALPPVTCHLSPSSSGVQGTESHAIIKSAGRAGGYNATELQNA